MCVILHMSVITQRGDSALMMAASEGETKVVVELVKAGANVEMQNRVCQKTYIYTCTCVCTCTCTNYVCTITISHTSSRCVMCLSSHRMETLH